MFLTLPSFVEADSTNIINLNYDLRKNFFPSFVIEFVTFFLDPCLMSVNT